MDQQVTHGARKRLGWQGALKGAVLGGALALATGAHATTYILDSGSMDHARSVTISGIGTVSAAPILFKASVNGDRESLLAWCVDVYHHITLTDYNPDLKYTDDNTLSNDFGAPPKPLDPGDVEKVGLLANYGQDVYDDVPVSPGAFTEHQPTRSQYPSGAAGTAAYNAALAKYNADKAAYNTALNAYNTAVTVRFTRLAEVQSAIWQVVSNRDVTSANHDHTFDQMVDNLSGAHLTDYFYGGYGAEGDAITLITPVQLFGGKNGKTPLSLTQSFVIAQVPEPATWALMILGFGGVGAMMRRRRAALAI